MTSLLSHENRIARFAVATVLLTFAFALTAARAQAAPGALNIVVIHSMCFSTSDLTLIGQLQAEPGVASVTQIESEDPAQDGGAGYVPTAADIASADAVVLKNDCRWADPVALGNLMADFQDRGGVVFADTWNFWDEANDPGYALRGRWASDYTPFLQFVSGTATLQLLGSRDPAHPFLKDVGSLANTTTYMNTALAGGSTQVASWADGSVALAVKGRAVGFNGFLGDNVENAGDYGRLIVNAIKALGPRGVSVGLAGSGKGTVTSSAGAIVCATTCDGTFLAGTPMTLNATPSKGSVFTGWTGACTGTSLACPYTVGYPGATAAAWNNAPVAANFASTKLRYGKFKKGKLSVTLPGAGKLVVTGSGIKRISKTVKKPGTAKLTVKTTGSVKKKLTAGKSVKVKFKFAFTPTGATKTTKTSKTIKLKK